MSRTIPSELILPGLGELTHPKEIESEDWLPMIQAGHYEHARQGARCPALAPSTGRGLISPDYAETSNAAYNQINEAGGAELEQRAGQLRLTRYLGGAADHRLRVTGFGRDGQVRIYWQAIDEPGTYSGLVALAFGGAEQWQSATVLLPTPVELKGSTGPALRLLRVWAIYRTTGSTGRLYHLDVEDDEQLDGADLASE